jgi:hypothetical protein
LDKKVLHLIACANLPFSIVDQATFKPLLAVPDRENLKGVIFSATVLQANTVNFTGYHHYADWVLPRMYELVKTKVKEVIDPCQVLSFTSDIWTGPTESFIRFLFEFALAW